MYIDTHSNRFERSRQCWNTDCINPEIIISTHTDTLNYYLSIHVNTFRRYECLRLEDDFVGQTSYRGFRVRVFGEKESVFYSVERKIERRRRCPNNLLVFYSRPTWGLAFHKDLSFCKTRTWFEGIACFEIPAILRLLIKHFEVSNCKYKNCEN